MNVGALILLFLALWYFSKKPVPPTNGEPPVDSEPPVTNGVQLTGGISITHQIIYGGPNRTLSKVIEFGNLSAVLVSFWRWNVELNTWQSYIVDGPTPSLKLSDVIWHGDLTGIRVSQDHFWSW